MSMVNCPYCKTEQEINHDDGYGYDESKEHEQQCTDCEREFKFYTSVSFSYTVECQKGDHKMESFGRGLHECSKCDFYEVRGRHNVATPPTEETKM